MAEKHDHHNERMTVEEELTWPERATKLRKEIESRTGIQEDSAEIIRQMRDERDEQLWNASR